MTYDDQKPGIIDARALQPDRAPAQAAGPSGDDAELTELRRALLLYGTAGKPAHGGPGAAEA